MRSHLSLFPYPVTFSYLTTPLSQFFPLPSMAVPDLAWDYFSSYELCRSSNCLLFSRLQMNLTSGPLHVLTKWTIWLKFCDPIYECPESIESVNKYLLVVLLCFVLFISFLSGTPCYLLQCQLGGEMEPSWITCVLSSTCFWFLISQLTFKNSTGIHSSPVLQLLTVIAPVPSQTVAASLWHASSANISSSRSTFCCSACSVNKTLNMNLQFDTFFNLAILTVSSKCRTTTFCFCYIFSFYLTGSTFSGKINGVFC